MPTVIAFDINETLLDLKPLDQLFEEHLGGADARPQWFAQMLQLSFVGGLTGRYVDFSSAQRAALTMLAERRGRTISAAAIDDIVGGMSALPPHPEVAAALARLASTELTVVALANSLPEVAEAQLTHAGLRPHFDAVFSAHDVKALKPAARPYQLVAERTGVPVAEVRLVAAHSWDITGALEAGCRAAFVARPGAVLSPLGPQPDIVGADLTQVVDGILRIDGVDQSA